MVNEYKCYQVIGVMSHMKADGQIIRTILVHS